MMLRLLQPLSMHPMGQGIEGAGNAQAAETEQRRSLV